MSADMLMAAAAAAFRRSSISDLDSDWVDQIAADGDCDVIVHWSDRDDR